MRGADCSAPAQLGGDRVGAARTTSAQTPPSGSPNEHGELAEGVSTSVSAPPPATCQDAARPTPPAPSWWLWRHEDGRPEVRGRSDVTKQTGSSSPDDNDDDDDDEYVAGGDEKTLSGGSEAARAFARAPETPATSSGDKSKRQQCQQHPLDAAGAISKLFFGWMLPFIWRGWRVGLSMADMPKEPSVHDKCEQVGATLVAEWRRELEASKSGHQRSASLGRALRRAHAKRILLNSFITFFSTNLLSNDLDKFNYLFIMLPFLWIGPIQTLVSIYLLWPTLGPSCLGALLILSLLTPIQVYLSKRFAYFRRRIASFTDERVRLLNETIASIRLIKLYGWEYYFQAAMHESRRKETDLINSVSIVKGISTALMYTSSKLVLFVTIILHSLVFGLRLDAQTLFMSMAVLNNVQLTMTQLMPRVVSMGAESLVSLARITEFLMVEEVSVLSKRSDQETTSKETSCDADNDIVNSDAQPSVSIGGTGALVELNQVSARWCGSERITLQGISFKCSSNELVVICGQVASGKSSLLMVLLDELAINKTGSALVRGNCGFSSQCPWIFNGSIRDNIVFGSDYNEQRYKQVVEACALLRDFELLEYGDLTYIQESSLSGGQKARVNLARCLYRDCDIYLLDDPFSAIDIKVAEFIFEHAIKRLLSDKLVLLTTHKVELLRHSDKILLIDQGRLLAFCDFPELARRFSSKTGEQFTSEQLARLAFLRDEFSRSSQQLKPTDSTGESLSDQQEKGSTGDQSDGTTFVHITGVHLKENPDSTSTRSCHSTACESSPEVDAPDESCDAISIAPNEPIIDKCKIVRHETREFRKQSAKQTNNSQKATDDHRLFRADELQVCKLGPATSESILNLTYGFADLAKSDRDKNLITTSKEAQIDPSYPVIAAASHASMANPPSSNVMIMSSNAGGADGTKKEQVKENLRQVCEVGGKDEMEFEKRGREWTNKVDVKRHRTIEAPSTYRLTMNKLSHTPPPPRQQVDEFTTAINLCESFLDKPSSLYDSLRTKGTPTDISNYRKPGEEDKPAKSENEPADEDQHTSRMSSLRVWYEYYTQTSLSRFLLIVFTFLLTQSLFSTVDIYLTVWSLVEQNTLVLSNIIDSNQRELARLDHQAFINQDYQGENEKKIGSIIKYDLQLEGSSIDLSSPPTTAYESDYFYHKRAQHSDDRADVIITPMSVDSNCTSRFVPNYISTAKVQLEIQKLHISPLSLRSSKHRVSAAPEISSLFVPPTLDLLYFSNCPPYVLQKVEYQSQQTTAGRWTNFNNAGNEQREFYKQPADGYKSLAPAIVDDGKSSGRGNGGVKAGQMDVVSPPDEASRAGATTHKQASEANLNLVELLFDSTIAKESDAALNVKPVYRPLYLFINNFTSSQHALTYTLMLMALLLTSTITSILSLTSSNRSAIALYRKLIDNALFAKLAFFDQNPCGRFLNRATRDIGIIDEAIPHNANQAYDTLLRTVATFIVVTAVDVKLALPSIVILFIFLIFHSIQIKPTKDIQRMEGVSKSPIVTHISTTLSGLCTIRASKSESRFQRLFMRYQDAHTSVFLLYIGCNRFTAVVLDTVNAVYTGLVAFFAVFAGLGDSSAGLLITSAMLLGGLTQHGIMKLSETESLMTSVERVIEYCNLPQEENYDTKRRKPSCQVRGSSIKSNIGIKHKMKLGWPNSFRLQTWMNKPAVVVKQLKETGRTNGWPDKGAVQYKHVDLYYRKLAKPVLKNVSFELKAGEKVGVIGRTGAGKSSIITSLFRLYDYEGTILIDGVDIKTVDLVDLRTSLGIIPQNPILFSMSIRKNLDPFEEHDDYILWSALDKAHLRDTVSALPGKLDYDIGSGGAFSTGQKQLMCLARVLLRQSSLIVMDEATANVDPNTDAIIQATIRREFKRCTVITIAHRIETILDYDRIMVLEAGRVVALDTPERLASSNIYFNSLLNKPYDK